VVTVDIAIENTHTKRLSRDSQAHISLSMNVYEANNDD
jgi:hypothetical protein